MAQSFTLCARLLKQGTEVMGLEEVSLVTWVTGRRAMLEEKSTKPSQACALPRDPANRWPYFSQFRFLPEDIGKVVIGTWLMFYTVRCLSCSSAPRDRQHSRQTRHSLVQTLCTPFHKLWASILQTCALARSKCRFMCV